MRSDWLDFYDREYFAVVKFLMRAGASLAAAEDAAQEAFMESWRLAQDPIRWQELREPRGWIRHVALRKYQRPPGSRTQPALADGVDIPDLPSFDHDPAELSTLTLTVLQALHDLEVDARTAMAFHLDGFTAGMIADQMKQTGNADITEQKVRDLLKKARKHLRRDLATRKEETR